MLSALSTQLSCRLQSITYIKGIKFHLFKIYEAWTTALHASIRVRKLICVLCWIYFLSMNSRPDRLRTIADRFNLDQNAVLDNVLYARAYTSKYKVSSCKTCKNIWYWITILILQKCLIFFIFFIYLFFFIQFFWTGNYI